MLRIDERHRAGYVRGDASCLGVGFECSTFNYNSGSFGRTGSTNRPPAGNSFRSSARAFARGSPRRPELEFRYEISPGATAECASTHHRSEGRYRRKASASLPPQRPDGCFSTSTDEPAGTKRGGYIRRLGAAGGSDGKDATRLGPLGALSVQDRFAYHGLL